MTKKSTNTKPKKLTEEETTREVYRFLCRGLNRDAILQHAQGQDWGLTPHALTAIIEKATTRLIETAADLNLDTEVGKALERLESLYQQAADAKETKTALAVQKEINSLLRLGERARRAKGSQPASGSSRINIVE